MKRVTLFICLLLLFTGCGEDNYTVKLTTAAQEVKIASFSKAITIDWGDGKTESYESTNKTKLKHTYANNRFHTIRMNADSLTELRYNNNQLTALDVSQNTDLTSLECGENQLTALDVSRNIALMDLWCSYNQLTALDVSKNTALTFLVCSFNQLTALDVSKNTDLRTLGCRNNQLITLDVSQNTALTFLDCRNNQLTADALNALFSGLPVHMDGTILIEENPGMNACNRSIAIRKGWHFETYDT